VQSVMAARQHGLQCRTARTRGEPAGRRQREQDQPWCATHRPKCTANVSPGATPAGPC